MFLNSSMTGKMSGLGTALPVAALLTVLSGPGNAGSTSGVCTLAKVQFQTSTDSGSTSSTTYTNVPDGEFAQKTTAKGCFIVNFVADTYLYPSDTIEVEATLDGTVMDPGPIYLDDGDNNLGASHPAAWMEANVPAGIHGIQIYWRVVGGATTAYMGVHTTTIGSAAPGT
jgi:hypothetical protein